MSNTWRLEHKIVIDSFLKFLNNKTNEYILKGGTALMMCYDLNRFSEDIDLDSKHRKDIISIIDEFCKANNYSFRIGKDTDTVKRCFIDYGDIGHKLKIETSFRRKSFDDVEIRTINGIAVYSINDLCIQKSGAYAARDKIRDLFDLTFITNKYYNQLNPYVRSTLRTAIEYKGLEQFDYVVKEQPDELIDIDVLAEGFLKMFDRLGILSDEESQDTIEEYISNKAPLQNQIQSAAEQPDSQVATKKDSSHKSFDLEI